MVAFVDEAVAYALKNGDTVSQKEFSSDGGIFHRYGGEMYVYAYDYDGGCVAHGLYPDWVGQNKIGLKDPQGVHVIERLRDLAASPDNGGFLEYSWEDPATHKLGKKFGYCRRVNQNWWLGSGIYLPDKSKDALISFVHEAAVYGRSKGVETAAAEFQQKGGMFNRYGGEWYVSSYKFDGTCLSNLNNPEFVGKNELDLTDENGVRMIKALSDACKTNGSGFVNYSWKHPVTRKVMAQSAYCERVNGDWFVTAAMPASDAPTHTLYTDDADAGFRDVLVTMISQAKDIRLTIYELDDQAVVNAMVQAKQGGANVQVIFNYYSFVEGHKTDPNNNPDAGEGAVNTKSVFSSAPTPVPFVNANNYYAVTHQKTFIFDQNSAMIMSMNLQPSYFGGTRDFAILTTDQGEVQEALWVFNQDYQDSLTPKSDLQEESLLWSNGSPDGGTSRPKLTELINSATKSVAVYTEEIASYSASKPVDPILTALIDQANKPAPNAVNVQVITAEMSSNIKYDPNLPTRCYLTQNGVHANPMLTTPSLYMHAKMVLVDYGLPGARAYIGSVNLSPGSMDYNRELGIIVDEPEILDTLNAQFSADWPTTHPDPSQDCTETD